MRRRRQSVSGLQRCWQRGRRCLAGQKNFEKDAIFLLIVIIRSLRRRKKTTDMTDSGYDTTAAGILIKKQNDEEMNTTIKTLIAMSKFKNLSKEQKGPGSEKNNEKSNTKRKGRTEAKYKRGPQD